MVRNMRFRLAWLALAWLCLALGIIGVFVPVMPTTPFVLAAAFAAARGSRRMHWRLLRDRRFGPIIREWARHGAIRRRAKVFASAMMAASAILVVWFSPRVWLTVGIVGTMLLTALWLWTRPEPRADRSVRERQALAGRGADPQRRGL